MEEGEGEGEGEEDACDGGDGCEGKAGEEELLVKIETACEERVSLCRKEEEVAPPSNTIKTKPKYPRTRNVSSHAPGRMLAVL